MLTHTVVLFPSKAQQCHLVPLPSSSTTFRFNYLGMVVWIFAFVWRTGVVERESWIRKQANFYFREWFLELNCPEACLEFRLKPTQPRDLLVGWGCVRFAPTVQKRSEVDLWKSHPHFVVKSFFLGVFFFCSQDCLVSTSVQWVSLVRGWSHGSTNR